MAVVLIKWAWPKIFRAHYYYNPTILEILDPPWASPGAGTPDYQLNTDSEALPLYNTMNS